MEEFLKQNWIYILYGVQAISLLTLGIILLVKNRKLKLLQIAEKAVEEAEKLPGSAEQKKTYAVSLIKQEMNASNKCISKVIENLIDFSKLVNSKSNRTIQEVLSDEFKKTNE